MKKGLLIAFVFSFTTAQAQFNLPNLGSLKSRKEKAVKEEPAKLPAIKEQINTFNGRLTYYRMADDFKYKTDYSRERFKRIEAMLNYCLSYVKRDTLIAKFKYAGDDTEMMDYLIATATPTDQSIDVSGYKSEYKFYENYNEAKKKRYQHINDSIAVVNKRIADSVAVVERIAYNKKVSEQKHIEDSLRYREIDIRDSTQNAQDSIKDRLHKQYCIKKYGAKLGTSIYNGHIDIGYTKQMVKDAWGDGYDEDTMIKQNVTVVTWTYSSNTWVIFRNGKVYMIKK